MMNRTTLLAAASLAILGGVLYALHLRHFEARASGFETAGVVVLLASVQPGDTINRTDLGIRQVPGRFAEDRHVHASQLIRVLGAKVKRELEIGSWLTWDDIDGDARESSNLSNAVPEGMRAFTVIMESSVFGQMVASGDNVDVLMSATRPREGPRTAASVFEVPFRLTTVLLQNVRVLSVGQRGVGTQRTNVGRGDDGADREARSARERGARFVTLEISLEDSIVLQHAIMYSELISLVVRNPLDGTIETEIPITTDLDLIEVEERARRQWRSNRRPSKIINLGDRRRQ